MTEHIVPENRVAIHEAGHAVVSHHFGIPIAKVKIGFDGNAIGRVENIEQDISELKAKYSAWNELEIYSLKLLGGMVAEYIYDNNPKKIKAFGGKKDLKKIQQFFSLIAKMELTKQQIIDLFFDRTLEILKNKWQAVEALAKILVKKRSIDGEEASNIIEENI